MKKLSLFKVSGDIYFCIDPGQRLGYAGKRTLNQEIANQESKGQ
jgi:hypothetical protein